MGPGEIVAARVAAAQPMPEGDANFVLVRHLFVRENKTFADPKELADKASDDKKKKPTITPAFSLTMHLGPIDSFLGAKREGDEVAPLTGAAPPWLTRIWPLARPRDIIPAGTPMIVLTPKDGDDAGGWVALGKAPRLELGSDVALGAAHDALEKVKVGEVEYYVVPQGADAHLDAWADRPTSPLATGKLCYFNEVSGGVLKTTHDVGKNVHLVVVDGGADGLSLDLHTVDGVDYARIDAFTQPGIYASDGAHHTFTTADDGAGHEIVVAPEKTKHLKVFLDTTGKGDDRFFPDPLWTDFDVARLVDANAEEARLADAADRSIHTLLAVLETAATGKKKVDRIWLKLQPCVALSASDRDKINGQLKDHDARMRRSAVTHLTKGTSRLAVALVSTEGDTEWTASPGDLTLQPTDGQTPSLYTSMTVKSGQLVVDTKVDDKSDHDTRQLVPDAVSSAPLHALAILKNKKGPSYGLVEIAYGIPVTDADAALKKKAADVDAQNSARVSLAKELLAGGVVDLRQRLSQGKKDLPGPEALRIGREKLGAAGRMVDVPGQESKAGGVHVEVFAGKPLATAKDVAASSFPDKSVVRVDGSPWLAYKDTDASDSELLSGNVARRLAAGLAKLAPPAFDPSPLHALPSSADDPNWTVSRPDWVEFCTRNDRLLSRVLSVHPSEWTLPWPSAAAQDDSVFQQQTKDSTDDVKRVHEALAWTTKDVTFIEGDAIPDATTLVFHSPPRLVEYLRTGIEVALSGKTSAELAKANVTFAPERGDSVPLTPALTSGRFSARLLVSEALTADARIRGTVRIDGVPQPLKFDNVEVMRGATTHMRVVEPWVSPAIEWPHDATGYAVEVKHATEAVQGNTVYFLGDGAKYLAAGGYARMHVTATAFYNDKCPKLTVKVEGAGFVAVQRAPQPPAQTPAPGTEREPQATTLDFDVFTGASGDKASAKLTLTAEGGDFQPSTQLTWTLATRKIEKGAVGPDVAQLQLYLSQIMAVDGAPCYRASARYEEVADDPAKRAAITIDGHYDEKHEGLRHALWRFCYSFAKGWVNDRVVVTADAAAKPPAKAASKPSVTASELADFAKAHPDALEHPDKVGHPKKEQTDLVAYVARTSGRGDPQAEWPIVDAAFVNLVVAAFPLAHAVPRADFAFASPVVPLAAPSGDGPAVTVGAVNDKIARALPLPGQMLRATLSSKTTAGVDPTEPVEITVPDKSPYLLSRDGSAASASSKLRVTLADVTHGMTFFLVTTQSASSHSDPVTVTAEVVGQRPWIIAHRQAMAPRDFLRAWGAGDAGRDAAQVQLWLVQAARKPKGADAPTRGYVPDPKKPTTIDGVWTDGWVRALRDYRSDWGPSSSSDALVKLLSASK
jgi:hypothetical protein